MNVKEIFLFVLDYILLIFLINRENPNGDALP